MLILFIRKNIIKHNKISISSDIEKDNSCSLLNVHEKQ